MTENTMPAAEAMVVDGDDRTSYELAFHVLPTVAEGEVASVVDALKAAITKVGGELFDEESPERVELAYEVVRPLEGRNRKFKSAYFGWLRFKSESSAVAALLEEVDVETRLLRHLLIKLTKEEEVTPFRFHEAMAAANLTVTSFALSDEEVEAEIVADEADVAEDIVVAAPVDTKEEVA